MTTRLQNRTALVQQVHVAMPGNNEILVRVKTVAINPTDWKRACVAIKLLYQPLYQTFAYISPSLSTDLKFICSKPTQPALHVVTSINHFCVDVGTICGADYAGEVVKVGPRQGPNISLKVGDRVAGIVHGGEREGTLNPWFNLTLF